MTGPEHYAAAQNIIEALERTDIDEYYSREAAALDMAQAQVHATLALAAATALAPANGSGLARIGPWLDVAS